ncbi:T9SS type B sorting domain-containing protein, partial [Xanthomarina sp. GH4-25]|uniref:T9SS type B sorting domain-containing protein n=1 Tax=Xanthomarina sp. GH4-25 TaxID=3349335 RepID=UPI003877B757
SGSYVITGLESGVYDSIVVMEDISGCTDNLGQIILDEPDLGFSIISTDLTSCESDDGTITISGLTSGNSYTITYLHNSVTETLLVTADASGNYVLIGLESGVYDSIVVTEDVSGCTDNLGQFDLECFNQELACFKTKLFFTPNGDGFNDYWNLIITSNACEYILYIFDRYGKLIKTLSPENNKWDGTYRGYNLPSNDYWYLIEYKINNKKQTYSSHFALKR